MTAFFITQRQTISLLSIAPASEGGTRISEGPEGVEAATNLHQREIMATELKNLSSYDPTKVASGKGRRVGIVYAEWNDEITYALRDGAVKTLIENGVEENDITLASVPGSFELIFGASQMVKSGKYDAVIAIGCVIRGDTPHFDYICEGVTAGLSRLNVEYDVPVIFGLITTNNLLQAQERSGGRLGNKGDECAITALQMMAQFKKQINGLAL